MFFILSKILAFIITPVIWIIAMLLFAIFSKNPKKKKRFLIICVSLFLFFTNSFIQTEFMHLWEVPAKIKTELRESYDAGIVLSGMISYDPKMGRLQFNRGIDRLLQAIDLYKKGIIKKILITGGSGSIANQETKEAPLIKVFMMSVGIPEEDIITENQSKNTHENAIMTKIELDKLTLSGHYLLITSAVHMRRSLGCFKKAGIPVDSYSTDRYTGETRHWAFDFLFIPNTDAMSGWNTLLHEIMGYISYAVAGYL